MTPTRILSEMRSLQWAITLPSLRAMLAVVDGEELNVEDYRFFHSVDKEDRESIRAASMFGRPVDNTSYTSIDGNVGYLDIDGPITPRATFFSRVSGMVSLDVLTKEFKKLEANPRVDTIVLLMDTPGGAVTGTSDFAALVKASSKKTVAFTWMAASAGYWIASAADVVISPPTGVNGSMGTILSITDYTEQQKKRGIRTIDIVSSQSPNKRPDPDTDEGLAVIQQMVDDTAQVFIETVADNRGMSAKDVIRKFGGGAMFVAARAKEAGMIDEISDAETLAKSLRKSSAIVPGISTSAKADITPMEVSMPGEDKKPTTAEELKESAAVKALTDKAAADERERLRSIEALATKFDGAHPAVKAAALKAINDHKFDAGATTETVSAHIVDAVSRAQVNAVDEVGHGRREAATVAAAASNAQEATGFEQGDTEASAARVSGLCAARKARLEKLNATGLE